MRNVLITGATGLIGQHTIYPLLKQGFTVYALTINDVNPPIKGVEWIKCNILNAREDELKKIICKIHPTHILSLAWCTTGNYLNSTLNELFYYSTMLIIRLALKHGCKRVIVAGSCFEYDFTKTKLYSISECATTVSSSEYSYYKLKLGEDVETLCKKYNASFGYARIFYVYGYPSQKFIVKMIENAIRSKPIELSGAIGKYDYIYSKDVAYALVKFLISGVQGYVNISTGRGVKLKTIANTIINLVNSSSEIIDNSNNLYNVIGDNYRLTNEVKYIPQYTMHAALLEMIDHYKNDVYTNN